MEHIVSHQHLCYLFHHIKIKWQEQWWSCLDQHISVLMMMISTSHLLHLMTDRGRVSPLTSKIISFNLTSIRHIGVVIYTWFRASSAACGKWGVRNTDCCPALWWTSWSHTVHRGSWNARHKRAQITLDASPYVLWKKRNQTQLVTCLMWSSNKLITVYFKSVYTSSIAA